MKARARRTAVALLPFVVASCTCRRDRADVTATHDEGDARSHPASTSEPPRSAGSIEVCEGPSFEVGPRSFVWAESDGPGGCAPRLVAGWWHGERRPVGDSDYVSIAVDESTLFVWAGPGIERVPLARPEQKATLTSFGEPLSAIAVDDDAVYFSTQGSSGAEHPVRIDVVAKDGGAARTFAALDAVDPPATRSFVSRIFFDARFVYAVECEEGCWVKRVPRGGGEVRTLASFPFTEGLPECAADGEVFCSTRTGLVRVGGAEKDLFAASLEDFGGGEVAVGKTQVCWQHDGLVGCRSRSSGGDEKTLLNPAGRYARLRVRDDVLYVRDGKTIAWFPLSAALP